MTFIECIRSEIEAISNSFSLNRYHYIPSLTINLTLFDIRQAPLYIPLGAS